MVNKAESLANVVLDLAATPTACAVAQPPTQELLAAYQRRAGGGLYRRARLCGQCA